MNRGVPGPGEQSGVNGGLDGWSFPPHTGRHLHLWFKGVHALTKSRTSHFVVPWTRNRSMYIGSVPPFNRDKNYYTLGHLFKKERKK